MTTDTHLAIHLEVLMIAARCAELAAVVERQDPASAYALREMAVLGQEVGKETRRTITEGER